MTAPTKQSQFHCWNAHSHFEKVFSAPNNKDQAVSDGIREGLKQIAKAIEQLAVGVRATYNLIEDVQKDIQTLKRPGP